MVLLGGNVCADCSKLNNVFWWVARVLEMQVILLNARYVL